MAFRTWANRGINLSRPRDLEAEAAERDKGRGNPNSLTALQRRLAEARKADPIASESKLMRQVGFSEGTIKSPGQNLPEGGSWELVRRLAKSQGKKPTGLLALEDSATELAATRIRNGEISDGGVVALLKIIADEKTNNPDLDLTPKREWSDRQWRILIRRAVLRAVRLALQNPTAWSEIAQEECGWIVADYRPGHHRPKGYSNRATVIDIQAIPADEVDE